MCPSDNKFKISPQAVGNLYRDWVMPLTKDVELEYLLRGGGGGRGGVMLGLWGVGWGWVWGGGGWGSRGGGEERGGGGGGGGDAAAGQEGGPKAEQEGHVCDLRMARVLHGRGRSAARECF